MTAHEGCAYERWKRHGAGGTLDRDASSVMHRSGCIGIAHDTGRAAAPHTRCRDRRRRCAACETRRRPPTGKSALRSHTAALLRWPLGPLDRPRPCPPAAARHSSLSLGQTPRSVPRVERGKKTPPASGGVRNEDKLRVRGIERITMQPFDRHIVGRRRRRHNQPSPTSRGFPVTSMKTTARHGTRCFPAPRSMWTTRDVPPESDTSDWNASGRYE